MNLHVVIMKQNVSKIVHSQNPMKRKNPRNHNYSNLVNIECPYCESLDSFLFWSKSDTIGHCPQCARNWVEYQGMVWTF